MILKYGNNPRRVHKSRAVKNGKEFFKESEDKATNDDEVEADTSQNANGENVDSNFQSDEEKENEYDDKQIESEDKVARKTSLRRPDVRRRIQFKKAGSSIWY